MWEFIDCTLAGFEPYMICFVFLKFFSAIWKTATLSTGPLQITNVESSNLIKYPQFFDKFGIDPSTFEYSCMYGENV